ncbi:MAG: preprotein translocase subunit SecG [Rhodospirillaceae bacterium]|nr:preprotein translocase subunit SecG [Rhodospirillaceae bacterium]MCK5546379.1 preprotein translocase subunit SecG [Rhodospirillaceae bacterium]
MITVVLVIHLMLAISLIGVVLIQKSEGGALGMGGGGGAGGGGFMTARGTANLLTRTTGILAALFMTTSIILAILSGAGQERSSILDSSEIAPISTPAPDSAPSVPVAK